MTPDDLDTKSLEELDAIFAVEVAGWRCDPTLPNLSFFRHPDDRREHHVTEFRFSSSADAVLPWLEKHEQWRSDYFKVKARTCVVVDGWDATALTFPHAAVKALIRAERAKKQV